MVKPRGRLLADPKIEPFLSTKVERSINTGMFRSRGPKGRVMPEGMLFPTKKAAQKEISRIARVFAAWTSSWDAQGTANQPPGD